MSQTTVHPTTRRAEHDTSEWTPSLAECVARVYGIVPLTEPHWRVISECREEWARSGNAPNPEQLATLSHLSVTELQSLFPPGQLSLAWILAGVALPPNPPAASNEITQPGTSTLVVNVVTPSALPKKGGGS